MTTLLFYEKKNMCSCDTHIQLITYSEQRTFAFAKNIIAYFLQNVNKIKIKFIILNCFFIIFTSLVKFYVGDLKIMLINIEFFSTIIFTFFANNNNVNL